MPQTGEDEAGTDALGANGLKQTALVIAENREVLAEARGRGDERIEVAAAAQLIEAAERGNDLLANAGALAMALDDLEVGVTTDHLLADEHVTALDSATT